MDHTGINQESNRLRGKLPFLFNRLKKTAPQLSGADKKVRIHIITTRCTRVECLDQWPQELLECLQGG